MLFHRAAILYLLISSYYYEEQSAGFTSGEKARFLCGESVVWWQAAHQAVGQALSQHLPFVTHLPAALAVKARGEGDD